MKMRLASIVLLVLSLMVAAPAFAATLYSNGPINGTVNAWDVESPLAVSNSFTISSTSTMTGFDAGFWLNSGDTAVSVDWLIGTSAFGSTLGSGTASLSNALFCSSCGIGSAYDIYTSTASGLSIGLGAGTYWLTLQNGVTAGTSGMYWDENDGPSLAQSSVVGAIGSEAFNIYGTTHTTIPEPGTLVMFASGILGLGGMLRRKLSL